MKKNKKENTTIKTSEKKNSKKISKKRRVAFTLIELLAVIVIIGVLMLIAIPSVTNYINESRKNAYVNTAKQYIKGATNLVNSGDLDVYDPGITYYIPSTCINLETGGESPYGGEFSPAYILVTYDNNSFNYYWMSRDNQSIGVKNPTLSDDIKTKSIVSGVNAEDIKTDIGIDGRDQYLIFNEDCSEKASEGLVFVHANQDGEILPEQPHDEGYLNLATRKYYYSLKDAVAEASSNQTIRVLKDVEEDTTATVASNVSGLLIDFNGHKVTYSYRVSNPIVNDGNIVLTDTTGQNGNLDIWSEMVNNGTIEVNGSLYIRSENTVFNNTGMLNIKSGEMIAYDALAIENTGTVNISGGSLNGYSYGVYNSGTLNITGGLVSGDRAIENNSGATTNITGKNSIVEGIQTGITNHGTLNYESGKIKVPSPYTGKGIINYGTATLKDVDIDVVSSNRSYRAFGISNESGEMTITGGTIISKSTSEGDSTGIYNNANLTIKNLEISSFSNNSAGIYASGMSLSGSSNTTIMGGSISGTGYGLVVNDSATLTLGSNDTNVSKTAPVIEGLSNRSVGLSFKGYGNKTFNFYDGIIKTKNSLDNVIKGEASNTNLPTGFTIKKEEKDSVFTAYLYR